MATKKKTGTKRKKTGTKKSPRRAAAKARPKLASVAKIEPKPTPAAVPKDMAKKVEEGDRVRLEAANSAVLVQANAIAALDAEARNLQTQIEMIQLRKAEAQRIGMEKQTVLQALGDELREQYNIPTTHDINIIDGTVVEKAPQRVPGAPPPQG